MFDRVHRPGPAHARDAGAPIEAGASDGAVSRSTFMPVPPSPTPPRTGSESRTPDTAADQSPLSPDPGPAGGGAGPGRGPGVIRRQVALGSYRLNTAGRLRDDTDEHAVVAELPAGTGVKVKDKGARNSLFKAGWFTTNEHSWTSAPGKSDGWIDDSKLDYSLADALEAAFPGARVIDDLQPIIRAATAEQRKQAAADKAFLGRAKVALDEDTYLALLPMLGVNERPSTSGLSDFGSAHTSGPDADRAIRTHLQQYVAEAVKAGRKVEGEVSVVGDEDFQMAFDRQWVVAAGQTFPGKKAWDVCNAFVDVNLPKRHIWVHKNMGNTGTVIHEGMHKYATDLLRDEQIAMCNRLSIAHGGTSRLDEGITEYFTRIVLTQLGMRMRENYENEFLVASKLSRLVGERVLAAAYYNGQFDALKSAVGVGWDTFAENLEKKNWKWLKTNGYM